MRRVADVDVGDVVAAVAFASDGRHAYAVKFPVHKLAVLDVDGEKVTYGDSDTVTTGLWPYNVAVTPDGRLALVTGNGSSGTSDGNVDTVSVVDLEASPPRAMDRGVVRRTGRRGWRSAHEGDLAVAFS